MATCEPYHSACPGAPKVHHTQGNCQEGNDIEDRWFRWGDGGFPLCQACSDVRTERRRQVLLEELRWLRAATSSSV